MVHLATTVYGLDGNLPDSSARFHYVREAKDGKCVAIAVRTV
jgi:hypothetical protein